MNGELVARLVAGGRRGLAASERLYGHTGVPTLFV
jgi:hypothetical protein